MTKVKPHTKQYVGNYRANARKRGGIILYAMLTDPKAIAAFYRLKKVFGTNRDAIENALIDSDEQMEKP